ncbi:MAG TPA: carboxypeptidase-like regulatory domain-containing protein [Candidatus Acidoferrales bacterium]|nr:carboxypeptidase-like regulatory domain-containing protein [Candidatus Acidoferrales bacterium]
MNTAKKNSREKTFGWKFPSFVTVSGSIVALSLSVLLCAYPAMAQSQQPTPVPPTENGRASAPGTPTTTAEQLQEERLTGDITGTVVDQTGAVVSRAHITLASADGAPNREVLSGENGEFSFSKVAPGPFKVTVLSAGLATQTYLGVLASGQFYIVPQIALTVATEVTEVRVVGLQQTELAEIQIKEQEKQRILGVIPNFYISYVHDAVPLTPKQKFELAWKTTIDPVTFVIVGATAGYEQAENQFSEYGQGAQGYGKRYGAAYADMITSTFIGGALFPALMKQDPRYFYKGTGSTRSRILYAIANAVICKGDNGHWQFNYSGILGGLVSGGISNLYYPPKDRGAGLVFESEGIGVGGSAVANLIQEFLIPKLTPNLPNHRAAAQP